MKKSEHIEAIRRQGARVVTAQRRLLVFIALKRAQDGNRMRFPFSLQGQYKHRKFYSYFEDALLVIIDASTYKHYEVLPIITAEHYAKEILEEE